MHVPYHREDYGDEAMAWPIISSEIHTYGYKSTGLLIYTNVISIYFLLVGSNGHFGWLWHWAFLSVPQSMCSTSAQLTASSIVEDP